MTSRSDSDVFKRQSERQRQKRYDENQKKIGFTKVAFYAKDYHLLKEIAKKHGISEKCLLNKIIKDYILKYDALNREK